MSFSTKDVIIFLIVVAFATVAQPAINSDFSTSNNIPLLPVEATASGYYNGVVSLIGGYYSQRSVIEYDIEADTFTTTTQALPTSGVGFDGTSYQFNQFWVQNGANVYVMNPSGTALQVYDLSTKTLTDNIAVIPIRVKRRACIASARDTLYIMGGGGSGSAPDSVLNTVQRFDISTAQWLSTKTMLAYRRELSCIYSPTNDALYAIGGWDQIYDLDSVEYVTVSDIETSAFQLTRASLSFGLTGTFALVYGAVVYILGGMVDDNGYWTFHDVIHILDTATNLITVSPHRLAYPVISPSGIVAENAIYLFGGEVAQVEETATNKWQFYVFSLPPSTTIWNTTPSQATTGASQQSNEAGQAAESDAIWIPVIIFLATATVVCCMCLVFCLIMKGKKNDDHEHEPQPRPQASQVQNKGIPAQPPMYAQGIPSISYNIQPMPVQATSTSTGADNIDVAAEHKTEIDIANENMVREWFAYTVGLPHFADLFIANGYENMHLIRAMQEQDLVAIGVRTIYHKQQILNAIRALNEFYEQGRVMHMHGEYNTGNGECVANENVNEGQVQTNGNVAIAEDEFVVHGDDDGIVENGQTDSRR